MNTSFERRKDRSDEWYTPKWIIDALGPFDLDPCAPSEQFYTANNEPRPIGFNSMAQISGEIEDEEYWPEEKK